MFSSKSYSPRLLLQIWVNFHYIQSNQLPRMGHCSHNMIAFDSIQPSSEFSACSSGKDRINSIDIERYMKRFISLWIKIINCLIHNFSYAQMSNMVHRKTFNVKFSKVYPFIRVNVSYRNKYNILERNFIDQPVESRDTLSQSSNMRNRITVIIRIVAFIWINKVRMSIHPDYFKVFIARIQSMKGWCTNRMISSNCNYQTLWMRFYCFNNCIVDLFKKIIQKLKVSQFMLSLFLVMTQFFVVG